jgi:hypothetical protein
MCRGASVAALSAASMLLSACASPYFVHDPQTFLINRDEVPRLLKALRCEIITYIAANNQRRMLFVYETSLERKRAKEDKTAVDEKRAIESKRREIENKKRAIEKFPYFELDPALFGGMALDLKIQDSIGMNSGTQFNWKRTYGDAAHSRAWNIGPTASDQSSYEALWNFALPQDIYFLDDAMTKDDPDFQCYRQIPLRQELPVEFKDVKDYIYVKQDIDGLAAGKYDDNNALFTRVRVNGATPLAGWLQDVSTEISRTTLLSVDDTQSDLVPPGQMTYTFTIIVTGGLDVKYALTSTVWAAVAGDVNAGMQQTSTITIILNGLEASNVVSSKSGTAKHLGAVALPVLAPTRHPAAVPGAGKPNLLKEPFNIPNIPSPSRPGYIGRTTPRGVPVYPLIQQPWGGAAQ